MISKFDTSNVINMHGMFQSCGKLATVDLRSFNTAKVVDMAFMFDSCRSLISIDLSMLDTSKVTNMKDMFYNCSSLKTLDLRSFDTSKVTNMHGMFYGCESLTNLDLKHFNTSKVTDMEWMFANCKNIKTLILTSFDTLKAGGLHYTFYRCNNLEILDLRSFIISTYCRDMFYGCDNLKILIAPKKNTSYAEIDLPDTMFDRSGERYHYLPKATKSILLARTPILATETFADVIDPSLWYYDSVYWAVKNGVTSGMGEGTFQPMAKLSRAQAVTFLYNLAGKPDVSKLKAKEFSDVPKSAWYYNAIKWAVAKKITSRYGTGTFQPNTTCNRAMIVTFLANYSKAVGTYKEPTVSSNFKDVAANAWYKKSVDWAVQNGITSGYGQGTFSPNVTCNRAMMVTFLKKVAALPKR